VLPPVPVLPPVDEAPPDAPPWPPASPPVPPSSLDAFDESSEPHAAAPTPAAKATTTIRQLTRKRIGYLCSGHTPDAGPQRSPMTAAAGGPDRKRARATAPAVLDISRAIALERNVAP